mgnify:CR=1 FL=1
MIPTMALSMGASSSPIARLAVLRLTTTTISPIPAPTESAATNVAPFLVVVVSSRTIISLTDHLTDHHRFLPPCLPHEFHLFPAENVLRRWSDDHAFLYRQRAAFLCSQFFRDCFRDQLSVKYRLRLFYRLITWNVFFLRLRLHSRFLFDLFLRVRLCRSLFQAAARCLKAHFRSRILWKPHHNQCALQVPLWS